MADTLFRRYSSAIIVGLLTAIFIQLWVTHSNDKAPLPNYTTAANKGMMAVVNIYTSRLIERQKHPILDDPEFRRLFPEVMDKKSTQNSLGSGVIMNHNGYILTNHHVIQDANQIRVVLLDGRETNANLVGQDPDTDLALLKIKLPNLPTIEFADSDALKVGDVVLAIGNPFGLGHTVTQGIISATGRKNLTLSRKLDFLQTDAAVNQGNSGGALIDTQGRLVGINSGILSESGGNLGIGFTTPINDALVIMDDLVQYGQRVQGWLGIQTQSLSHIKTDVKQQYGFPIDINGQLVLSVAEGGPSQQAGLRVGDIIIRLNNMEMATPMSIRKATRDIKPNQSIQIEFLRDGKIMTAQVTAAPM